MAMQVEAQGRTHVELLTYLFRRIYLSAGGRSVAFRGGCRCHKADGGKFGKPKASLLLPRRGRKPEGRAVSLVRWLPGSPMSV